MLYESTRGKYRQVSSAEAIKLGISPDGGLFVPCENVVFDRDALCRMVGLDYQERAYLILKEYLLYIL